MEAEQLSEVLWRQRRAVEMLVYRLEVERLVLSSSDRWAAQAALEVDEAVEHLNGVEAERAQATAALAAARGLPPSATLRQICDALDEPWRYIFDDHHRSLAAAVHEARHLRAANHRLLRASHEQALDDLSWTSGAATSDGQGPVDLWSD